MKITRSKYVINGRTYNSLEEMPEEDRRFFLDQNQNGIPDFVENLLPADALQKMGSQTIESRTIEITSEQTVVGAETTASSLLKTASVAPRASDQAGPEAAPPLPHEVPAFIAPPAAPPVSRLAWLLGGIFLGILLVVIAMALAT